MEVQAGRYRSEDEHEDGEDLQDTVTGDRLVGEPDCRDADKDAGENLAKAIHEAVNFQRERVDAAAHRSVGGWPGSSVIAGKA